MSPEEKPETWNWEELGFNIVKPNFKDFFFYPNNSTWCVQMWIIVFLCGPAVNWLLVQGVTGLRQATAGILPPETLSAGEMGIEKEMRWDEMRSNLDSSEPSNHRLINDGQPFPCIPLLLILSFIFFLKWHYLLFSRVKPYPQLLMQSYSPISTQLFCMWLSNKGSLRDGSRQLKYDRIMESYFD